MGEPVAQSDFTSTIIDREDDAQLASALGKARRRLLPFLIVCYFAAYLDRVNIGFAALAMNSDLGIGPEAFGFVAGIFFIGYCLFEVPSNMILARVGAGVWIARIMVTWALVSAATALVSNVWQLAIARFLLGVAEAGFFPGIIFYLTLWFPSSQRAAIVAMFMAAVPVSSLLGAPVSGFILQNLDGLWALSGWQWLFILEALPSLVLGVAAYYLLTESPQHAGWLSDREKQALSDELARDHARAAGLKHVSLRLTLLDLNVLALAIVYFGIVAGMYGLGFWLPQIIKNFGLTDLQTGWVTAIPYVFATIAMILWGRHSDRTGERRWHVALPCFAGGLAFFISLFVTDNILSLVCMSVATVGIYAAVSMFWVLPTALLGPAMAAAGIAFINSVGNLGGFAGPYVIGWIGAQGISTEGAVASLAGFILCSGLIVALQRRNS